MSRATTELPFVPRASKLGRRKMTRECAREREKVHERVSERERERTGPRDLLEQLPKGDMVSVPI